VGRKTLTQSAQSTCFLAAVKMMGTRCS